MLNSTAAQITLSHQIRATPLVGFTYHQRSWHYDLFLNIINQSIYHPWLPLELLLNKLPLIFNDIELILELFPPFPKFLKRCIQLLQILLFLSLHVLKVFDFFIVGFGQAVDLFHFYPYRLLEVVLFLSLLSFHLLQVFCQSGLDLFQSLNIVFLLF